MLYRRKGGMKGPSVGPSSAGSRFSTNKRPTLANRDEGEYCQSKGVLVLTAGTYVNVIRFLPPIVITEDLLLDALGVLDEAFGSL